MESNVYFSLLNDEGVIFAFKVPFLYWPIFLQISVLDPGFYEGHSFMFVELDCISTLDLSGFAAYE